METAASAAPSAAAKTGKEEDEAEVLPVVPFDACLAAFASPQTIQDYASPALPADAPRTTAVTTQRFKTFPPYLVVHLQRYYIDVATWQGKKMEVSVPMPLELDLTALRCVLRAVWGCGFYGGVVRCLMVVG
jgi:ubiquitin carboxyl-terminal hydrolase 5/13